jgi:hypothetical protein
MRPARRQESSAADRRSPGSPSSGCFRLSLAAHACVDLLEEVIAKHGAAKLTLRRPGRRSS